jgi:Holliday junction resolvasome RuvABC endonuclease subunit
MVRRLVERVPADLPEDAADALAVAICHVHRARPLPGRVPVGEVAP